MDAALDAMRQLGFEEKIIRDTVEELLDVSFLFFKYFEQKKKVLIFPLFSFTLKKVLIFLCFSGL